MKKSTRKLSHQDSFLSTASTDTNGSPKKSLDVSGFRKSVSGGYNDLSNARVIQSRLVYVINLPESAAKEPVLRSQEYFGQYGTIVKCVANKNSQHIAYQAHITYSTDEEAAVCIKTCNRFVLEGNELTLTFGTTKYCNYFLKGNTCPKSDCLYLHEFANDTNVVPRDVIPRTKHIQPSNSILDRLKVLVYGPDGNYKLPSVHILRDRAFSQDFLISGRKPFGSKGKFGFLEEGDETEVPAHMKQLRKISSPKDEVAEIPLFLYENLHSYLVLETWLTDILQFKLHQHKVLVFSKS
jgi:RNA recognition motif. (a.k.a. RRM, RBD, or RNP domain)